MNNQPINQVEDEVANDNLNKTDLQEFEASADYYERCRRSRIKVHQTPWCVAIGVYLNLISVAFVSL